MGGLGKYHPHGDTATYETLVRLAQDFSMRYPLINGQGNFGNIDGDNAAAYRYTEAKLTVLALSLMEGLDEDAVDFEETYDGEDREPVVLPAAFPALLANGVQGIAVGMATSIPPHNLGELIQGCLRLIQKQSLIQCRADANHPGPDFPTGGILVDPPEVMRQAYETGQGGFRLRAKWEVEKAQRRHLSNHRHPNPLSGCEGQIGGAVGSPDRRTQGALAGQCLRPIG